MIDSKALAGRDVFPRVIVESWYKFGAYVSTVVIQNNRPRSERRQPQYLLDYWAIRAEVVTQDGEV